MSREPQLLERGDVALAGAPVVPPEAPGATESLQEEIRRRPVVFLAELARLLDTSPRTIERQLRAGTFFIPETAKVDKRHRWSRARVYAAIAETTLDSHRRSLLGPRAVPQRKAAGEGVRERSGR